MRLLVVPLLALACQHETITPPPPPVELAEAPPGDAAVVIENRDALEVGRGRKLLVYVGATWCHPCRAFHDALTRGALDAAFAGTTFLEFDADRDKDRLDAAGYSSTYVPLFVRPGPDGRGSDRRTSGVRTGVDPIADLAPRLHALLDQ